MSKPSYAEQKLEQHAQYLVGKRLESVTLHGNGDTKYLRWIFEDGHFQDFIVEVIVPINRTPQ